MISAYSSQTIEVYTKGAEIDKANRQSHVVINVGHIDLRKFCGHIRI